MFVRDLPWSGDVTVPRPFSRSHDFPRFPLPKHAIYKGELCGPIEGPGHRPSAQLAGSESLGKARK